MKTATAPEICNAIMDSFMGYFGTPIRIVCDQNPAFMSHLTQWFLHTYGIHVTTASPTNHQSLMAEHQIKGLASILMNHLTGLGDNWLLYCKPAMIVYNSFATPNLDNLSPFEVALGRKAVLAPRFEFKLLLLVIMLKHMLSCKKDFCFSEKDWKNLDPTECPL